jgi:hypothetical protein
MVSFVIYIKYGGQKLRSVIRQNLDWKSYFLMKIILRLHVGTRQTYSCRKILKTFYCIYIKGRAICPLTPSNYPKIVSNGCSLLLFPLGSFRCSRHSRSNTYANEKLLSLIGNFR